MKERYMEFIKDCLDKNNVDGICSFNYYKKLTAHLIEDGFLEKNKK